MQRMSENLLEIKRKESDLETSKYLAKYCLWDTVTLTKECATRLPEMRQNSI